MCNKNLSKKADVRCKNIVTYLIGIVFLLSSVAKVVALSAFANEVRLYLEIYFGGWLCEYSECIAIMVCILEGIIGIFCFLPIVRHYANIVAILALTFFVYLTGDNYFNPSDSIGQIESCGCFGEFIHFTPLASFIKSFALWCMAATNLFYEIHFSSHA